MGYIGRYTAPSIVDLESPVSVDGTTIIENGVLKNVGIDGIKLKSSGDSITKSDGTTAVLSESGGAVTLTADEANVGSNALVVDSSGNVGVGTSSPSSDAKLVISKDNATGIEFSIDDAVAGENRIFSYNRTSNASVPLQFNVERLAVITGDSERMHIDSSGRVGIGTSSPASPLSLKSSYLKDGTSGNSFDVYFPIATFELKNLNSSGLNGSGDNGDSEFVITKGTDLMLWDYGDLSQNSGSTVSSLVLLRPLSYSVNFRLIICGDANTVNDNSNAIVGARVSHDNGSNWINFDFGTNYDHQYYNSRYLGASPWVKPSFGNITNRNNQGRIKFGVRSDSAYDMVVTKIAVQFAYVAD